MVFSFKNLIIFRLQNTVLKVKGMHTFFRIHVVLLDRFYFSLIVSIYELQSQGGKMHLNTNLTHPLKKRPFSIKVVFGNGCIPFGIQIIQSKETRKEC